MSDTKNDRQTQTRMTYFEWRRDVDGCLALGGRKAKEFRTAPWRTWHAAGLRASVVAVMLLAHEGVRLPDGRIKKLNG